MNGGSPAPPMSEVEENIRLTAFRTLKSSSGPHMANLLPDWISVLCLSFLSFCPQMPSLMIVPHTVIWFLCLCGHAYSC
ncbi:hypothetical protein NC653_014616 [Populus alba x Populus x berolinensis]|uniref:Uncharacterized protein n=1 Tax=Populus alba x Populus x berolinensis TaxID=444605 RepID=A0AAD6W4M6_9ROSI|nr:hypothetical protein NC653_014616 [Populus alba x Populus x berolinensis]